MWSFFWLLYLINLKGSYTGWSSSINKAILILTTNLNHFKLASCYTVFKIFRWIATNFWCLIMTMDNTGLNTSCAPAPHVSQPNFYGNSRPTLSLVNLLIRTTLPPSLKDIQVWTNTGGALLTPFLKTSFYY